VFDEVTKREGGKRAARRIRYLIGSSAAQVAIVVGIVSVSAAISARVSEGPLVPVKIVRTVTPAPPPAPPAPPPPKAAPRAKQPPKAKPNPMAMIQPKEMPAELKPPEPAQEPEDFGSENGVEGGVVGGVVGGVTGGAPEPPKAGPVKFNTTMTPPVLISGPPLEYTQQALEREIEGVMVVECVVTVDGKVYACRVLKSLPFMDRAVVENLEHRRYKPATFGGKPLDVQYTFTIRLKLPQ
jgi:protein TonB